MTNEELQGELENGELESPIPVPKYDPATGDNFSTLYATVSEYLNEDELAMVKRAYEFAKDAHKGQCRKSGEPFIIHPVEAAIILSDLRMDVETICAALLHDTVEDSDVTIEDVSDLFGENVALLVDGVTKLTQIEIENLSDAQVMNLRKMFMAMAKDIRVIVIKLADRLHNMRTLGALREDRRIFKARETMEIYAPLAHRLGIGSIKWELEDLAFYYLEPAKYNQVAKMVAETRASREQYLEQATEALSKELEKANIKARIMGRPKHLYSIYQKMVSKGREFSEIYDLIALRVIVDTVADCYGALGVAHTLWTPMPNRFKDYIALPKRNMYSSLHTTVIGPVGRPLEIQIRTVEMHRASEYGVAAHWRYKEGEGSSSKTVDEHLSWIREMLDWQTETSDSREFMEALRIDLFDKEVFVFTPKGDVLSLRAGSTPVDFAYSIHTEVGHHCIGAKVNGMIVPLAYELQTGDRVEILTQKNGKPSRDWLNIVKTSTARAKIRSYFRNLTRDDDQQLGRDMLFKETRRSSPNISHAQISRVLRTICKEYNCETEEELLVAIGTDHLSPRMVSNRVIREILKEAEAKSQTSAGLQFDTGAVSASSIANKPKVQTNRINQTGVVVKGLDDLLVRLSRCCTPAPGDEIVGFVTRGRGVSVHRADCPNAIAMKESTPERVIEVSWGSEAPSHVRVEIVVMANDRMRLLQDVIMAVSNEGANIIAMNTITHKDHISEMHFSFEISDINRVTTMLNKLRSIDGVFEANRMLPSAKKKRG